MSVVNITGGVLMRALVEAQRAVSPVGKASRNAHHDYRYASGDDMIAEARAALNGAGLAVYATKWERTEHPYQYEDDNGKMRDDVEYRLFVSFRLAHEDGEAEDFAPFSVPILPERGRPIDKAEAGARTYALSYFLRDLLLIPRTAAAAANTETDPDGRDDRTHVPPKKAAEKRAQARAAQPAQPTKPEAKVRTPEDVTRRYDRLCADFHDRAIDIDAVLTPFGGIFEITDENAGPAYLALGRFFREHLEHTKRPPVSAEVPENPASMPDPPAAPAPVPEPEPEPKPNSPEDLGVNRAAPPMPPPKKAEAVGGLSAKVREMRSRCDHLANKLGGDAPARLLEELDRIGNVVWEPEQFGTVEQARALSQLGPLQSKLHDEQRQKNTAAPAAP